MNIDPVYCCPVDHEPLVEAVSLSDCCHKINESVAKQLFGDKKTGFCPVCRQTVTGYSIDHSFREVVKKATLPQENIDEEEQLEKEFDEVCKVREIYKEAMDSDWDHLRIDAMVTLGDMYKQGKTVKQSYQRAHYWYSKAEKLGSNYRIPKQKKYIIKNAVQREIIAKGKERMTPDPILSERSCLIM